MPTVDQLTERFASDMTRVAHMAAGQSCVNCRHSRKTKSTMPGEMLCLLDDTHVETKFSCVAWSALFKGGL